VRTKSCSDDRLLVLMSVVLTTILSVGAGEGQAQGTWTRITAGRGATCSDGSPYSFWVRRRKAAVC
jgi:hypothetical protein